MAMKTARFELNNPYQKFGLKRKPTFNEIVGLISHEQKTLKPFLDRRATQFRNSPQGSFFDGSDAVELLKEQQNRIMDRQMRDLMMRRQVQQNGGTLHLEQHLQSSGQTTPIDSESYNTASLPPSDVVVCHTDAERELQERARQQITRDQEMAQRHEQLVRQYVSPVMEDMLRRQIPQIPQTASASAGIQYSDDEEELVADDDHQQFRQQQQQQQQVPPSLPETPLQEINYGVSMKTWERKTIDQIKYQFFLRGIEVPEENEVEEELKPIKGKGSGKAPGRTYKRYLLDLLQDTIDEGTWAMPISDEDVTARKKQWMRKRGKNKGKSFSESISEGAKEGVKQVAKAAAIKGGEMLVKRAFGI